MLTLQIPKIEAWDEKTEEFVTINSFNLQLEHSLLSLSKWEAKTCKPFLSRNNLSNEELIEYIRCMTITQNVNPRFYELIPPDIYNKINDYISAPMTATTFSNERSTKGSATVVTSELIYFWMISYNIPFECEKWHLNRLLTLIRVCEAKNSPGKKMSKQEILNRNRALNASRRAKSKSKG